MRRTEGSDGLVHGPDEGSEAEFGLGLVEGVETVEEHGHAVILHKGDDCRCQRRPGMCAVMWLAGLGAASLYLAEGREAAAGTLVQHFKYVLVVCEIVGYEYRFHLIMILRGAGADVRLPGMLLFVETFVMLLALVLDTVAGEDAVEGRHEEQREQGGECKTADHGDTHGPPHFRSLA